MPKILLNPYRNNLSAQGLTLRHDELLDQPVRTTSDVVFNSIAVGDLHASGSIIFTGNITEIETVRLSIKDNIIDINEGNTDPLLRGGFTVQRGPGLVPFDIVYDEPSKLLRIGFDDADLQAVATRQDDPTDGNIAVWNDAAGRFDARNHVDLPFAFNDDVTVNRSIIFQKSGIGIDDAPYVTAESSGDLLLSSNRDVILGNPDAPIGTSVVVPAGRKLAFGSTSIFADAYGGLVVDTGKITLDPATGVSWGAASVNSNASGNDLLLRGSNLTLNADTALSIPNTVPFLHAGLATFRPTSSSVYSIASAGDLVLGAGSTGSVVVTNLSINRLVRLDVDVAGNLDVTSTGDVFLSPNKNVVVDPGKNLCLGGNLDMYLSVDASGDLIINSSAALKLGAVNGVTFPSGVPFNIGSNGSIYEASDGTFHLSSTRNIYLTPGTLSSIILPLNTLLIFGNTESIASNGSNLTFAAAGQIQLVGSSGVNIPKNLPLSFGDGYHTIFQDNANNLFLKSSHAVIIEATERVTIDSQILSVGNGLIFQDTDGSMTFAPSTPENYVKVAGDFFVSSTDPANDDGTASLTTNGGVYVARNLVVAQGTRLASGVNVSGVVSVNDAAVPIQISNSSATNGTAIGMTARWDFTGGYTIGRGSPDIGGGRSMCFTVPPYTAYGMGYGPSFFFGSANGTPYLLFDDTGMNLASGIMYVSSTLPNALTVQGGANVQDISVNNSIIAGNGTFTVSPTEVNVRSQLYVFNSLIGLHDNGNAYMFVMDSNQNSFYMPTVFESDVAIGGALSVIGTLSISGGLTVNGNLDLRNHKILNLRDPTSDYEPATKYYVDSFLRGFSAKEAAVAATTENLDLSAPVYNLDDVSVGLHDRILVKDQTDQLENGIYVLDADNMASRANDMIDGTDVTGSTVFVVSGTNYGSIGFVMVGSPIVIGTNPVVWTPFSGASQIQTGSGLSKSGNTFYVNTDDSTIQVDEGNNSLRVAPGFISSRGLVGGIGGIPVSTSVDQSHVTTLGTITSGTWNADVIQPRYGGTGLTSLPSGYLLVGNGPALFTTTNKIYIDPVSGNVGLQTTTPQSNLHVVNVSGTSAGTWLRLQDTAAVTNQSSGILVNTNNNNAKIAVRSDGSLYIGQEDFTAASTVVLNTQRIARLSIDHGGNVVIGNNPVIGTNKLSIYGSFASTGGANINGSLVLPSVTIASDALGNTVLTTPGIRITGTFDVGTDAVLGNVKFVSSVAGRTSIVSSDRTTTLGLPMYLQTGPTNTSAICASNTLIVPGTLQIGGVVGDVTSGFSLSTVDDNLVLKPGVSGANILFNAPMSYGYGISFYDRSKPADFVTQSVYSTYMYIQTNTTTVSGPYSLVIGGGTNEMITTFTNRANSATITYDPTATSEYSGGVFAVSDGILSTFGSEVRLMDVLRYSMANSMECLLGNAGWYYLGPLGIGRTTMSLSLSWRIRLDYDGISYYRPTILNYDRNVASLVIYRTDSDTFQLFVHVLSGPCRVSVLESPVKYYANRYEGAGVTPNGQYSNFNAGDTAAAWILDLDSSQAQSNAQLDFGSIDVLGSATINNAQLRGATTLSGDLAVTGNVEIVGDSILYTDPATSNPKVSLQKDTDGISNIVVLHGDNDTSPALVLDRTLVNASLAMLPDNIGTYAGALLLSHNSNDASSNILFSTRGNLAMLIDSTGNTQVLSTADGIEGGNVSLNVKGGAIFAKRVMFSGATYHTELRLTNKASGAYIPMICDDDRTINVSNGRVSGLADPVNDTDAVNMRYVLGRLQGISAKTSVVAGSSGNDVDVSGALNVLDGITLASGDRVLLKDQANPVENGIYVIQHGIAPTRAADMAVGSNAAATYVFVSQGTVNVSSGWICNDIPGQDVVGVNALTFAQFSGAGQFTAGPGIIKVGSILQVSVDNSSIEIANGSLRVKSTIAGQGLSGGSGNALSVSSVSHLDALGTIRHGTWNADVVSMAYGGTGNTNFGVGRIPYSTGLSLAQGMLYFDDVNVRLGINTLTPTAGLTVQDRDIQVSQTVAGASYLLFTSSLTNYMYAIRNDASKLVISSGTGTNKFTLNDVVSLDNAGVLSVTNSIRANSVVCGNTLRIAGRSVENLSNGPLSLSLYSQDNTGTYLNFYGGLGTSNSSTDSEFMRIGYYNANYVIQTTSAGVGVPRNLCFQAGSNTNQLMLQPNGQVSFNARLHVNSTADAVSLSDGGSLTVLGGAAFGGNVYARNITCTSSNDAAIAVAGGIFAAKYTLSGAYQNYTVSADDDGNLMLSGNRVYTSANLHLTSYSADNGNDVFIKVFGLGKTSISTAEWLQIGYESASATYTMRTLQGGSSSQRPLILSATVDSNQFTLNTDNSIVTAGPLTVTGGLSISGIQDATSALLGFPAVKVAGGVAVGKSLYVGSTISAPLLQVSTYAEFSSAGSTDTVRLNYVSTGKINFYNNGACTINVHTGNSLGPNSPNQEKLILGYKDASAHVVQSFASGTGTVKDLVLTTSGNVDQIRLYSGDKSVGIAGDLDLRSNLTVGGGMSVAGDVDFARSVTFGTGTDVGTLLTYNGLAPWIVTSVDTRNLAFQALGDDSALSFLDSTGNKVLSVDVANKVVTAASPLLITGTSAKALSVQNGAGIDLFVFDSLNHVFDAAGGMIRNLAYPQLAADAATKSYVDNLIKGLNLKAATHVAAVGNVDLTRSLTTLDDVDISPGYRVLLMFQTNSVENGIYVVSTNNMLTRADDFSVGSRAAGAFCFVEKGTLRGDKGYVCIADYPNDVVGTNALVFTQFNGNVVSAGLGLFKDGNNIMNVSLDPVGSGLSFNGNYLRVDPSFAGSGLEYNGGVLSLAPVTTLSIVTAGTWHGSVVDMAYGGTGSTTFVDRGIVFSDGTKLTTSPNFIFDVNNALTISSAGVTDLAKDVLTVQNRDVSIRGDTNGLYFGDTLQQFYNWGIARSNAVSYSPLRHMNAQPWRNTVMSKDGQKILLLTEPGYPDYISSDEGYHWEILTVDGQPHVWIEVVMSHDGSVILMCASEDYLYVSTDGGANYRRAVTDMTRIWEWCSISDNGQYMLASSLADGMFASSDSGTTWTLVANIPTDTVDLGFVHVSKDGSTQFAGYFGGFLYQSNDYGVTFAKRNDVRDGNYYDIAEARDANVLVLYEDTGSVFVSNDMGATWSEKLADRSRSWVAASVSPDGSAIAVAESGGNVYFSQNFGDVWNQLFGGLTALWKFVVVAEDDVGVIAGGGNVPLYVTTDAGATYDTITDRNVDVNNAGLSPGGLLYFGDYNGLPYRYLYRPSSCLVISGGKSGSKDDLRPFVVCSDRQMVGIGYGTNDAGYISNTLDVNGTLYVDNTVQFNVPLNTSSGGTGANALSYGLVVANGSDPFTTTDKLLNGSVPIGSSDGTGRIVVESGDVLRQHLGLGIGTHVQSWSAILDGIAALTPTQGQFIMGNGTSFVLGSAAAAGDSMGLGQLAYLDTVDNSVFSGIALSVANGGTGTTSFSANVLPYYDGAANIFKDSPFSFDKTNGGVALNGTSVPGGSGLAVYGKDVSLLPVGSDATPTRMLFHNVDGSVAWCVRKSNDGGANGTSSLVFSGGVPNVDKAILTDRLTMFANGDLALSSTSESNGMATQGALRVSGGATFGKSIYVGAPGKLFVANTTDATATPSADGAIVISGGLYVGKTLMTSSLSVTNTVTFSSTVDATSATAASVVYRGGIGVGGKIYNRGGLIVDVTANGTVGNKASGMTIASDAAPLWTDNVTMIDAYRHVTLVNDATSGATVLSMRNLTAINGWDLIAEGTGTNRLAWQSYAVGTDVATTWMTLDSTTGNLSVKSTNASSVDTAGGMTVAKNITCGGLAVTNGTDDAEVGIVVQNANNGTASSAALRLYNNTGTTTGAKLALNSSTRTIDGGANNLILRNDLGGVTIQGSAQMGIDVTAAGNATLDGSLIVSSNADATSSTSGGAATVLGGLAVAKSGFVGGNLTVAGTLNVTGATSSPTVTTVGADLVNVSTVTVKSARLVTNNDQRALMATFKVTPTAGSLNTQFTFNLPGRTTNFVESLDLDTGMCSGFTDTINYIVLQNTLCTGVPDSTKAMVKFQSVSTSTHYLQVYVSYIAT